jgi:uridine phosphorylase
MQTGRNRMTEPREDDMGEGPPILRNKNHRAPSVFTPDALLREARRQKKIGAGTVPDVCVLDPDGDILRHLLATGRARRLRQWACYHTDLHGFDQEGLSCGIVDRAVGAAFAVLVAEELFASGCKLLISVTSAGQIVPVRDPPYFIIIDRALRDEGTSYHYLAPSDYSPADERLVRLAGRSLAAGGMPVQMGAAWTTDAPFRETAGAIGAAQAAGILAVEMEAAALYAFAAARERAVLCFAHITNQMGRVDGDFEKGAADGAEESLRLITLVGQAWCERGSRMPTRGSEAWP